MSDDDQEARNKAFLEEFNRRMEGGEPIITFPLREVLRSAVASTGEMVVDFEVGELGGPRVSVVRLGISLAAAQSLKALLIENKNIPDTPPPARDPQSTH